MVSDHGGQPMAGGTAGAGRAARAAHADRRGRGRLVQHAGVGRGRLPRAGVSQREGREPQDTVPAGDYETVREGLIGKLEALVDHQGRPMGTRAFRPQQLYPRSAGPRPT